MNIPKSHQPITTVIHHISRVERIRSSDFKLSLQQYEHLCWHVPDLYPRRHHLTRNIFFQPASSPRPMGTYHTRPVNDKYLSSTIAYIRQHQSHRLNTVTKKGYPGEVIGPEPPTSLDMASPAMRRKPQTRIMMEKERSEESEARSNRVSRPPWIVECVVPVKQQDSSISTSFPV